jgi:hypothetical protein
MALRIPSRSGEIDTLPSMATRPKPLHGIPNRGLEPYIGRPVLNTTTGA